MISAFEAVRELAVRQHGVFTRRQLVELGLSGSLIDDWVATRRIEAVHRGVYALSRHLLSSEGRRLAAVFAVGDGAALSHFSAAAHWGIRPGEGRRPDVTCPRRLRARAGIHLHCLPLPNDEVAEHGGIPVTTPARTIFDLSASLGLRALARMWRESELLRLDAGLPLAELVERYPRRAGAPRAARLLDEVWRLAPTRSDLEDRFLELVHAARLPQPEVNALVDAAGERFEVDFLWRRARLIVELDGFESHGTRSGFEADRRRDRLLQLAGFDVFRVTYGQLVTDRDVLLRDLRDRLAAVA